jgi:hypothetical protein
MRLVVLFTLSLLRHTGLHTTLEQRLPRALSCTYSLTLIYELLNTPLPIVHVFHKAGAYTSDRTIQHLNMKGFPSTTATMPTTRPFLPVFLLFLGTLALLTQLLPPLTRTLAPHLSLPHFSSACTSEIGAGLCCDLLLGAEPCVEQCREKHLDRETFTLTNEYDECADRCLIVYKGSCEGREGEKRRGLVDDASDFEGRGIVVDDDFSEEGAAGREGPNAADG